MDSRVLLLAVIACTLSGCSAVEFYWQGIAGQADLLARAKPMAEVMRQSGGDTSSSAPAFIGFELLEDALRLTDAETDGQRQSQQQDCAEHVLRQH